MLRNFRRIFKKNRIFVVIILGTILFGLISYFTPNNYLNKNAANDSDTDVVARVYGRNIFNKDVNYQLSNALLKFGDSSDNNELIPLLKTQIINNLIHSKLIDELAERYDITVTDIELRAELEHFLIKSGFINTDGKLLPSEKINEILIRNFDISLKKLEKDIRSRLIYRALFSQTAMQVPVDSEWVELENAIQNTKFNLESVTLTPDLTKIAEPDSLTLEKFFKKFGANFQLGTRRIIEYVLLKKNDLQLLPIDDKTLKSAYNANKNQFTELHLRHILLKVNKDNTEQEVINKANSIRNKIKSNNDFKNMVELYSQDKNSKYKNGDLGWLTFDNITKEFKEPLKNLQIGSTTEPICTALGIHLLYLDGRRYKDFDKVKTDLLEKINFENFNIQAKEQLEKLRKAVSKYKSLETEAKAMNLKYKISPPLLKDINYNLDGIDSKEIISEIFNIKVGNFSNVTQIDHGNAFILFRVREERPFSIPQINEVRDQVISAWKLEEARIALTNNVKRLAEQNNLQLIGTPKSYISASIANELSEFRSHPGICRALLNTNIGKLTPIFWTPDGKLWIAKINSRSLTNKSTFKTRKAIVDTLQMHFANDRLLNELQYIEQQGNKHPGLSSMYGRFNGIWRNNK